MVISSRKFFKADRYRYVVPIFSFQEGPKFLQLIMSSEKTLFLGLLAFRFINALMVQTSYVPDEYWQSIEVAHNMAFG